MSNHSVSLYDATMAVWRDTEAEARKDYAAVLKLLASLGFKHRECEYARKHYPTLAKGRRRAEHGRLKLKIDQSGRTLKLDFYQSEVVENPNGGEYDFNRLAKMPYLIRLRFQWARERILAMLAGRGLAVEDRNCQYWPALDSFNRGWGKDRFRRGPDGWPDASELKSWDRKDGDGVQVEQGDMRYVQVQHRWSRVQVFGGINGMWFCYANGSLVENVNVGRLRSVFPGRGRIPELSARRNAIQRRLTDAVKAERYLDAHRLRTALQSLKMTGKSTA